MQAVLTPASSPAGLELPILNLPAFERTAGFLDAESIQSYMATLVVRSEALLHAVHDRTLTAAVRADSAHSLAGSAGLLSFERLAFAARSYERAVTAASPDTGVFITQLVAAIEDSVLEMRSRMSNRAP
jgi:HPt (histidine-containing phosphotransfer) domain-containing protein